MTGKRWGGVSTWIAWFLFVISFPLLAAGLICAGRPVGIQLHMKLSLSASQFIILGLFIPPQSMPLNKTKNHTLGLCVHTFNPIPVQSKRIASSAIQWNIPGRNNNFLCVSSENEKKIVIKNRVPYEKKDFCILYERKKET